LDLLITRLKELANLVPLEDNYNWEFPTPPIDIPEDIDDLYLRNIYLKENLNSVLQNDINLKNHYWIIQEWGGIKALKQNYKNDNKINMFKKQLPIRKLTQETFSVISSFSKLASFINPNEYAIYDSRAIYSLNWLLFNFTKERELYPQPQGRNPKLSQYDLQTIFNLSKTTIIYKSNEIAYFEYCDLLKFLSKEVYGDTKPYKIEMLLFLIGPSEIIECIKKKTELIIHI
jgi:hypothetical protein